MRRSRAIAFGCTRFRMLQVPPTRWCGTGWRNSEDSSTSRMAARPCLVEPVPLDSRAPRCDGRMRVGESWFEIGLLNPAGYLGVWLYRNVNAPAVNPPGLTSPSAPVRRL